MNTMRLTLLLLTLIPAMSDADEVAATKPAVTLEVRPVLCITDERTPVCQISFLVLWQGEQTGYYCLYNDFSDSSIRCWVEEKSGELSDERTVQTDFQYWMTGDDADTQLASVKVEVLRMDTGDRRRKRRTRHVWDIL